MAKSKSKLKAKKLKKKAARLGDKLVEKARRKGHGQRDVLAVCNRCGAAKKEANELVQWLEERVERDRKLQGQLAIQRVGCLGPCPKKKLTVALGGERSGDWSRGFLVDPRKDRAALLSLLSQRLAV